MVPAAILLAFSMLLLLATAKLQNVVLVLPEDEATPPWPKDLGFFYYSCGQHPVAMTEVFRRLRQFYPSSFVYLLSTCGRDLSLFAEKYSVQRYIRRNLVAGRRALYGSVYLDRHNPRFLKNWLGHFAEAGSLSGCAWLLLTEDDVWLQQHHRTLPGNPA
eukprot:RCo044697